MTIVEALKGLHIAFGGNASDTEDARTTVEVLNEITKVVDGMVLKVRAVPVVDDTDLFGKTADDLQSSIKVHKNAITGTLKYVADYSSAFSGDEASGNYIALKAESADGATIKAQVVGGTHGEVTLDSDRILVARIASNEQSIRFTATLNDKTATVEFALTDLVLEQEPAEQPAEQAE